MQTSLERSVAPRRSGIARTVLGLPFSHEWTDRSVSFRIEGPDRELAVTLVPAEGRLVSKQAEWFYWDLDSRFQVDWGRDAGRVRDVFSFAASWGWDAATYHEDADDAELQPSESGPVRELLVALREVKLRAYGLLDQSRARVARRFAPQTRLLAYARMAGDPTGRIAQLAASCPGAFLLAFALELPGNAPFKQELAARLFAGVVAGRRLDPLLDEALHTLYENHDLTKGEPAETRQARARAHRWIVRRAGPFASGLRLAIPMECTVRADHVPSGVRLDLWLEGHHRVREAFDRRRVPAPLRRAAMSFVAVHGQKFAAREAYQGGLPPAELLAEYVALERRVLSADCGYEATMEVANTIHVNRWRRSQLAPEAVLPVPEWPPSSVPGLTVRFFRTAGEMYEESARMHHCVGTYADQAAYGRGVFGHADFHGAPLTFYLEPGRAAWHVAELKGIANRMPTHKEAAAVQAWCASLPPPSSAVQSAPPGPAYGPYGLMALAGAPAPADDAPGDIPF